MEVAAGTAAAAAATTRPPPPPPAPGPPSLPPNAVASFKPSVSFLEAMKELVPSTDPLDSPNFDAVAYINELFPTEESLKDLDPVVGKLDAKINRVERELTTSVRNLAVSDTTALSDLDAAKSSIMDLFAKINNIKRKAESSEAMVEELCSGIKSLDYAKRNLEATATALRRLHMLMTALEQLKSNKKNLRRSAELLQALNSLADIFEGYKEVPRISELHGMMKAQREALAAAVYEEFSALDRKGNPDACMLIEALGSAEQKKFMDWFTNRELLDYARYFRSGDEACRVENSDKRYVWMRSAWKRYDEQYEAIFPASWNMCEFITLEFAFFTRDQLLEELDKRNAANTLDVGALIRALQKTIEFEREMSERFAANAPDAAASLAEAAAPAPDDRSQSRANLRLQWRRDYAQRVAMELAAVRAVAAAEELSPEEQAQREAIAMSDLKASRWKGLISSAFDLYLHSYILQEDKHMGEVMEKVVREETWLADGDRSKVLTSSMDMIYYFEKTMKRISELTRGQALFDLFKLFKKYLKEYARALLDHVPTADAGTPLKLTEQQERTLCHIINTAEYCSSTTEVIANRVCNKISAAFVPAIKMDEERDAFAAVLGAALKALVLSTEGKLEPSLQAMTKVSWASMEAVGDTSEYLLQLGQTLSQSVAAYERQLVAPIHFTFLCDSIVTSVVAAFRANIYRCKRIGDVGAEQLLLDVSSLKGALLELLQISSNLAPSSVKRYSKLVNKEMGRLELLVKTLISDPSTLVAHYKSFVGDTTEADFAKLLDLKGIKNPDYNRLLEQYRQTLAPPPSSSPVPGAAPAANLAAPPGAVAKSSPALKRDESSLRNLFSKFT